LDKSLENNFDGFIIATPAETHFKLAKEIINNKKDLLVEKPLTLSIKESEIWLNLLRKMM
jgi:predicted dehydrogenase